MKWTHITLVLFLNCSFYGQTFVKINYMHHFIIEQFVRYKMAFKMAAKIVYLNMKVTQNTLPVVSKLRSRSQK